jgi:hypothetical protein
VRRGALSAHSRARRIPVKLLVTERKRVWRPAAESSGKQNAVALDSSRRRLLLVRERGSEISPVGCSRSSFFLPLRG